LGQSKISDARSGFTLISGLKFERLQLFHRYVFIHTETFQPFQLFHRFAFYQIDPVQPF
jgi:hypothetical protein